MPSFIPGTMVALFLLMGFAIPSQAIDFAQKKVVTYDGDGDRTEFYFVHEGKRILYRPPLIWKVEGNSGQFYAVPPTPLIGSLTIKTIAPLRGVADPGTKEALELLAPEALAQFASPQAETLKKESVVTGGMTSARYTVDYGSGLPMKGVVIFARFRPNLWVQFKITSTVDNMERILNPALVSLDGFIETSTPAE